MDWSIHTRVRQNGRVDDDLDGVITGGQEGCPYHVEPCSHLRWVVLEVKGDLVAVYVNSHAKGKLGIPDLLAVKSVFECVPTVRNLEQASSGLPLSVVKQC